MNDAVRMSYANIKTVPSRKVFQAVFEGPIEQMMEFMELFGAPNGHAETWAGIARLRDDVAPEPAILPQPANDADDDAGHPPRPLSQVSAILCGIVAFRVFLSETFGMWEHQPTTDEAADFVRKHCRVHSRKELDTNDVAARRFKDLRSRYEFWRNAA